MARRSLPSARSSTPAAASATVVLPRPRRHLDADRQPVRAGPAAHGRRRPAGEVVRRACSACGRARSRVSPCSGAGWGRRGRGSTSKRSPKRRIGPRARPSGRSSVVRDRARRRRTARSDRHRVPAARRHGRRLGVQRVAPTATGDRRGRLRADVVGAASEAAPRGVDDSADAAAGPRSRDSDQLPRRPPGAPAPRSACADRASRRSARGRRSTPSTGTRPAVGFNAATPAEVRGQPDRWRPSRCRARTRDSPEATAAASPPLDPPTVRDGHTGSRCARTPRSPSRSRRRRAAVRLADERSAGVEQPLYGDSGPRRHRRIGLDPQRKRPARDLDVVLDRERGTRQRASPIAPDRARGGRRRR